jgi:hypothetical protein
MANINECMGPICSNPLSRSRYNVKEDFNDINTVTDNRYFVKPEYPELKKSTKRVIKYTPEEVEKAPFVLFQNHFDVYYNMSADSIKGLQVETILSKIFFSPENVDIIQKQIIKEVFQRTNGQFLIEKQDETDLQVRMRSMFIQHARHIADNIYGQIEELNNFVIDDSVPNIISEAKQYVGYCDRAFGPRRILDRPEYSSSRGTKTIPSMTNSWK